MIGENDQVTEIQQPQDTATQVIDQQPANVQEPQNAAAQAPEQPANVQQPQYTAPQQPNAPYYAAATDNSKTYTVLSYLGILWLVGLLGNQKNNPRVRFHVNQGIILSIFTVALWIVSAILNTIIGTIFTENYYGLIVYTSRTGILLQGVVGLITSGLILAGMIIGIVHAVKSEDKPLPVIGKLFKIVK